ncbi:MAG TPA: CDP-alcohol phosphatidyltransferase family protein [Spirochaetia bacterium]|nr:CDP-alcohol phosphatidyltransferase family protein [Spirochaetia bacterium]
MTTSPDQSTPHLLTVPNALSFFRLATSPLVLLLFSLDSAGGRVLTLIFLLISFSTDFLDGYLARRLKQQSDAGRILDPLADKAVVLCLLAAVVIFRDVSIWFVIALLGRELLILSGGLFIKAKKGIVVESNLVGKAATAVLMAAFLCFVFEALRVPGFVLLYAGLVLAATSLVTYAFVFFRLFRRPHS